MHYKNFTLYVFVLVLLVSVAVSFPAHAASEGLGQYAGIHHEGVLVTLGTGYSFTFDSNGIPTNTSARGCFLDYSDLASQKNMYGYSPDNAYPSIVTISYKTPEDVWAVADCMGKIRAGISNYFGAGHPFKVLINLDAIFNQDQGCVGQSFDCYNKQHPAYQQRAAAWYSRMLTYGDTAQYPTFPASEILGLIPHEENLVSGVRNHVEVTTDGTKWSNGEMNSSIQYGTDLWTAGPNWAQVDTVGGYPVIHQQFPRQNSRFPWRLDVVVMYEYNTYNPNSQTSSDNVDTRNEWFDYIDQWQSYLNKNNHQRVALNIRGAIINGDWTVGNIRYTLLAWCNWSLWQDRFHSSATASDDHPMQWTVIWTWRTYGTGIVGLYDNTVNFTGDSNSNGVSDTSDQVQRMFAVAEGNAANCYIQ